MNYTKMVSSFANKSAVHTVCAFAFGVDEPRVPKRATRRECDILV